MWQPKQPRSAMSFSPRAASPWPGAAATGVGLDFSKS